MAANGQKVSVALHREALEAILVNMPLPRRAICRTKSLAIGSREIPEKARSLILIIRFDNKVPIVRHQLASQHPKRNPRKGVLDQNFEPPVIVRREKKLLALGAAIQNVVDMAGLETTPSGNHRCPALKQD